jgi:hypothetical protein
MDSVFKLLDVVYDGFYEFGMFMPFHALVVVWRTFSVEIFPGIYLVVNVVFVKRIIAVFISDWEHQECNGCLYGYS